MPFSSNPAQTTPKTIAYLRVSTIDQDLEKNKSTKLALANGKVLARVHIVEQKWLLYFCGRIVKTCHLKCSGYFLYARKQGADQIRSMRFT
ncbi:MAG: hypothetical protein M3Q45_14985 [Chloroflexota bacterium]|nr:hypothetical protein [Chloroflexota bacterium]